MLVYICREQRKRLTKQLEIMRFNNQEITEMAKDLSTRSPYQIQQELFNILWLTRRDSKTEDFNILVKSIKENNKYVNDPYKIIAEFINN